MWLCGACGVRGGGRRRAGREGVGKAVEGVGGRGEESFVVVAVFCCCCCLFVCFEFSSGLFVCFCCFVCWFVGLLVSVSVSWERGRGGFVACFDCQL